MKKLMDLLVYILTPKMTKNRRIYYFISQILKVFPTFVGGGILHNFSLYATEFGPTGVAFWHLDINFGRLGVALAL